MRSCSYAISASRGVCRLWARPVRMDKSMLGNAVQPLLDDSEDVGAPRSNAVRMSLAETPACIACCLAARCRPSLRCGVGDLSLPRLAVYSAGSALAFMATAGSSVAMSLSCLLPLSALRGSNEPAAAVALHGVTLLCVARGSSGASR